jgi:hypothetical protein
MEHNETLTVMLPVEVKISYEFRNPFKSERETPSSISIDVKIFLTREEAEALDEELTNLIIRMLNTIFEARKLEALREATKKAFEEVFDTDPA